MKAWRAVVAGMALLSVGEYASSAETLARSPAFAAPSHCAPISRALRLRRNVACELSCHGDLTHPRATKKTFYIPATSRLDWREYRSRLIQAETPVWMRRLSHETGIWAHQISSLERGCLLIETGQLLPDVKLEGLDVSSVQDLLDMHWDSSTFSTDGSKKVRDARVILLLSHDDKRGSWGLVLNKATACSIGDFTEKLPIFKDNTVYFGGKLAPNDANSDTATRGELHTLHSCRDMEGATEIVDGVYLGADVAEASRLVDMRKARASDFKFFYSAVQWMPGELEKEMREMKWVAAACAKELVLKPPSYWQKPLWRMVLEVMGGKFGLISRYLSSDL